MKYTKIVLEDSLRLRELHQVKKHHLRDLVKMYPQYTKSSIRLHMVKGRTNLSGDKRKENGRKKTCARQSSNDSVEKKRKKYSPIPVENSIHMRYLHQDLGVRGKNLVKKYRRFAKSSVYDHMKMPIKAAPYDKRKKNPGRPQVLSDRDKRMIVNKLPKIRKETEGEFTLEDLKESASIQESISISTISRVVHKEGYSLRDKRRKGVLTEEDTKIRVKFAKHAKKVLGEDIWTKGISFYLDGTGFTHKVNPCQDARRKGRKTWRKRSEGESLYCTGAGSREGDGGRVAKFMVTIAYGKGVTMCYEYWEKLNGSSFAEFILAHLPPCFKNSANPVTKTLLQDGDPSQNSAIAMSALASIGGNPCEEP